MSFILDALRKSEQERLRHQNPGMADLRARGTAVSRPYWLPLVIFLVGLNIGLLMFLWLNSGPPTDKTAAGIPTAEPAANPAASVPTPAAASTTKPSPSLTAPAAARSRGTESLAEQPTPPISAAAAPVRATTQNRDLSSELPPGPTRANASSTTISANNFDGPGAEAAYSNLPTLTELTMAGSLSIDPLRIDMHVFSPQPAERFVFINMNKYREGDSLREGPVLTTITQDGVILDYRGRSFLVTRE